MKQHTDEYWVAFGLFSKYIKIMVKCHSLFNLYYNIPCYSYLLVLNWWLLYVTCSTISHFDPKTHFEFYTLLERGDYSLSNDISIVFGPQI